MSEEQVQQPVISAREELYLHVRSLGTSEEVDYDSWSLLDGQAPYVYDPRNRLDARSAAIYAQFAKWVEGRGGPKEFLWASDRYIAGVRELTYAERQQRPGEELPVEPTFTYVDEVGKTQLAKWVHVVRLINKYKRLVLFPARLNTLAAHYGLDDPFQWPLDQVSQGSSWDDIAYSVGVSTPVLMQEMWQHADPARIKAAWSARTELMAQKADNLLNAALDGDFDSVCGREAAESRASVLSKVSGHVKTQLVAHHTAYRPQATGAAVTPGAINITFSMPQLGQNK
jgi:hypothetical protein